MKVGQGWDYYNILLISGPLHVMRILAFMSQTESQTVKREVMAGGAGA